MNKNTLFFAVLGFFSVTIASEEIITQDTIATEEACVAVETTVTEAVEAVEIAVADAAFIPMKFTLSYNVTTGADASTADLDAAITTMRELIDAGHRGSPSLYQNLLVFVKELQEAIVAGMNLFGTASTSQESIVTIVEEAAIAAVTETVENALEKISQEAPSKGIVEDVTNNFTIAYSIVVDKVENLALWESVKAQMIALSEALNMRTKSPAELSSMLETIMNDAQPLHNSLTTLSANTHTQE